jgi:hypothetical protein
MSKVKKKSRKKKKQAKRKQISVRKDEKRPDGPEEAVVKSDDSGFGIEKENVTAGLVDERPVQAVKSLPALKMSKTTRRPWLSLLAVILMCGLTFVIYSNTLSVPFVFDDRTNITANPAIRITGLTFENLFNSAFESSMPTRPLANVSLALNYYFHEYELPGYHIVNIVIHAVTGILLYFLFVMTLRTPALKRTFVMPGIMAFSAAVIWLAHPLQTQSVTYVVQRMNSIATMFYLLAMLLYVIARLSTTKRLKIFFFIGCILSGLAGFGSKEIVMTLPFFILLYEFYFFQDLDVNWFKSRAFAIGAMLTILGAVILAVYKLGSIASGYDGRQFTMAQRLLTEPRVVIFHISQLFFPVPARLNLFHDFPISVSIVQPLTTIFSVTALAALLGLAVRFARRRRLLSFCILWYLGNLVLESSVFPLEIIFEHRNYLPSTFFCLIFSCLVIQGLSFIRFKALAPVILLLILMTFSYWTYERNNVWGDEETLLIDCLEKAPNVARTQASLGYVLMWQWRLDEAMQRFQIALGLNPTMDVRRRIQTNMEFIDKMRKYPGYHKK